MTWMIVLISIATGAPLPQTIPASIYSVRYTGKVVPANSIDENQCYEIAAMVAADYNKTNSDKVRAECRKQ
jgi:hypothetical protein